MKQRDALPIFSFTNYYGAQATTVLLNASNSIKYHVKTDALIQQHKRIETLLQRDSIDDLSSAEGRLIHLRDSEVVLFKVSRSNYWQARFRIYTGKWIRFSTRRRNMDDAKQIACDRYDEARYRERLGFTALVKRFDEMAKCCIAEIRRDIAAGTGKKIFTAYIAVIETYLIPFFGSGSETLVLQRMRHTDPRNGARHLPGSLPDSPSRNTGQLPWFATAYPYLD